MTRDQLHIAFKIAMDKNSASAAFGGCPAFLDEEIDYWLNQGMYQEVSNKFTGLNTLKQPFEQSVKRIHDLEKLVKTDSAIELNHSTGNECIAHDLFKNRMFFVSATFRFDGNTSNIALIDHSSAKRFKQSYDNLPYIASPVSYIENNELHILYDPISMKADKYFVDITYIKYPTKVEDLTDEGMIEFPEYMQYEIVNRAVELALEGIESKRVQTKSQFNQLDE